MTNETVDPFSSPNACTCSYDDSDEMTQHSALCAKWTPPARPSFDQVFMEFAQSLARRSTCSRAQVGCVVVTGDNHRILSMGYNGGAKGVFNECLSDEPGKCGHLHAEINALVKMNFNEAAAKKMYTTTVPCFACSVAIVNAGVSEVIYLNEYRMKDGLELLQRAGISVRKHGG